MHRTLSAAELLNIWSDRYARLVDMLGPSVKRAPETGRFHTRFSLREGDEKAKETGPFEEWRPDIEDAVKDIEDPTMRRWRAANAQHSAVSSSTVSLSRTRTANHSTAECVQQLPSPWLARYF